jgi:hypothetical protein
MCPGALARRVARLSARRRLLSLRRASRCLGTSRVSSSTTSPMSRVRVPRQVARLVVDYFAYATRLGASARRAARRAAFRRILHLCHASECLGTSRGSSRDSSSTTSPRAGSYAARPGASARRMARLAARHRLLRLRCASGCLGTSRGSSHRSSCGSSRRSSSTTSLTPCVRVPRHVTRLVVYYFAYAVRPGASTHHAANHAARR